MITIKYFIYLFILFIVINFPTGKFSATKEALEPYRCPDLLPLPWYVFYDESSEVPRNFKVKRHRMGKKGALLIGCDRRGLLAPATGLCNTSLYEKKNIGKSI